MNKNKPKKLSPKSPIIIKINRVNSRSHYVIVPIATQKKTIQPPRLAQAAPFVQTTREKKKKFDPWGATPLVEAVPRSVI